MKKISFTQKEYKNVVVKMRIYGLTMLAIGIAVGGLLQKVFHG